MLDDDININNNSAPPQEANDLKSTDQIKLDNLNHIEYDLNLTDKVENENMEPNDEKLGPNYSMAFFYIVLGASFKKVFFHNASVDTLQIYILYSNLIWNIYIHSKSFNKDEILNQKLYVSWILILFLTYEKNCSKSLGFEDLSAMIVVPYILCRLSLSISLWSQRTWVIKHQCQKLVYRALIIIASFLWISALFVSSKINIKIAFALLFLDRIAFELGIHPLIKKYKLDVTTIKFERIIGYVFMTFLVLIFEYQVEFRRMKYKLPSTVLLHICCLIASLKFAKKHFRTLKSLKTIDLLKRNKFTRYLYSIINLSFVMSLLLAGYTANVLIIVNNTLVAYRNDPKFLFTGSIAFAFFSLGILEDLSLYYSKRKDLWNSLNYLAGILSLCLYLIKLSTAKLIVLIMIIILLSPVPKGDVGKERNEEKESITP